MTRRPLWNTLVDMQFRVWGGRRVLQAALALGMFPMVGAAQVVYTFTQPGGFKYNFFSDPANVIGDCTNPPRTGASNSFCLTVFYNANPDGPNPQKGVYTMTPPSDVSGTVHPDGTLILDTATFNVTTAGLSLTNFQISNGDQNGNADPGVAVCSGGAAGFNCLTNGLQALGPAANGTYSISLNMVVQFQVQFTGQDPQTERFGVIFSWTLVPSSASFKIDHIEAIQVVQDGVDPSSPNHEVPYFAGKTTLVRAFVRSTTDKDVPDIGGTMNGVGDIDRVTHVTDHETTTAHPTPGSRFDRQAGVDFEIKNPPPGPMKLSIDLTAGSGEKVHADSAITFVDNTTAPKNFYVGYIVFCTGTPGAKTCPKTEDLGERSEIAESVFPFPEGTIQYFPIALDNQLLQGSTDFPTFDIVLSRILLKYYVLLNLYSQPVIPRIDHLVGFVPPIDRGECPGGPVCFADYEVVAELLDGSTRISWGPGDFFLRAGNYLAHRLGRQWGLKDHKGNVGDLGYVSHGWYFVNSADESLMAAGVPDEYSTFSVADYQTLYTKPADDAILVLGTAAPVAKAESARASGGASDYVVVSGTVKLDGSQAQIDPVYHVSTSRPQVASDPKANSCLEFRNGGSAVGQYCFNVDLSSLGMPGVNQQFFAVTAPWPAGTTELVLVRGGSTLATLSAAAKDPVVTITTPQAGGQLQHNGTISWSVAGAAGPVVSTVLYSSDGGNNWTPLVADSKELQYTFDTSKIMGGSQVFLRVIAASGLNSGSATVGPINVPQTPKLGATVAALDFGNVLVGRQAIETLAITNSGTGPLTIGGINFDNPAFSVFAGGPKGPLVVGSQFTLSISFNPSAAGAQQGTLTIQSGDPSIASLTIPLTGTGFTSAQPSIGVIAAPIDFGNVPVGQTGEMSLPLVNHGVANLSVTSISSSDPEFTIGGPAVPLTLATSEQDVTLRFTPNGTGLKTAAVTVASNDPTHPSLMVQVQGTGTAANGAAPLINSGGVVDAASFQHVLAPGGLATIFGLNFTAGSTTGAASSLPLPTILAGVSVTVAGIPAPLVYVKSTQINFQVPFEVTAGTSAPVVVTANGVSSASVVVQVATYAVGVFTYARTATAVDPVILHALTNQLVTPSNPAKAGEALIVYATGVGNLVNRPLTGFGAPSQPLAMAADTPQVTLGGAAIQVLFAGLTPGFAGLVQLNLQLPASLPAGTSLPLVIQFPNSNPSVAVNLSVAGTPGASITVSPGTLDFGSVNVGQSKDLTLTVNNTGSAGANVTVSSSNAQFTASPATAFPVGANSSAQVTVHFAPAATGLQSATLTISTGGATQSIQVNASGTGTSGTGANVIRTLAYNEITRFPKEVLFSNGGMPVLSASGNRIVYANAPGVETDARYNDIFVINADGSGQHEVDSYKQNCDCGAVVDISGDGNTVVSTDSIELRIASAMGSAGTQLITNREIPYIRISPPGDKVFFINRRGDASASDPTTERGLYVINADGSGLQQVAGPSAVATLLGLTPDKVFPFATNGWSLDVSSDGTKVVFGVATPNGEQILGVNADGTGLRLVLGPVDFVNHVALSGDGGKVAYDVTPPPCCSTPNEIGVVNFDGSNRKALATNSANFSTSNRMELNGDGSELLYGNSSYLYATDGSGVLQLSALGGSFSSDSAPLVGDGLFLPTMNTSASRFAYISKDAAGVPQLATMDINPTALGGAPAITSPALTQAVIGLNGSNPSLVTAKVTTSNQISRVSAAVLNSGISDPNVNDPVMVDDGTNGDQVAGDGIYTGTISANCCAVLGPRNVRVKAEVHDSAGVRHATAIEFGGLSVGATSASRH